MTESKINPEDIIIYPCISIGEPNSPTHSLAIYFNSEKEALEKKQQIISNEIIVEVLEYHLKYSTLTYDEQTLLESIISVGGKYA
jgi:hypothetical protein